MRALILRAFPYSTDGVTARYLEPGAIEEIADDMAPGLALEGYIRPPPRTGRQPEPAPEPEFTDGAAPAPPARRARA